MPQYKLFGFTIGTPEPKKSKEKIRSIVPDLEGSTITLNDAGMAVGGAYQVGFDQRAFETIHSENALMRKYREISMFPEVDFAIEEISSEAIVFDDVKPPITLNLDKTDLPDSIKQKVNDNFQEVLRLLEFNKRGHDVFRRWYVDGRLYYHIMIDENDPKSGIKGLRHIDPRKIKKVRRKKGVPKGTQAAQTMKPYGSTMIRDMDDVLLNDKLYEEFYLYSNYGVDNQKSGTNAVSISAQQDDSKAVAIAIDSIAYSDCGIYDKQGKIVLSHLHKAIRPANNLKNMEDAMLIYRIARAPERKAFYVDVGNLPKAQAEAQMQAMISKYRTKQIYDPNTGELKDDVRVMALTEDYWLPRREGSRGTEISVIPGGQNLGETNDVIYFQEKLFRSLNLPMGRFNQEKATGGLAIFSNSQEVTREELRFGRFITRMRMRFNMLFEDVLSKQLSLLGVMSIDDFNKIKNDIVYIYSQDNHYTEITENSILQNRLQLLQQTDAYMGVYFSKDYVRKNILRFDDDDIEKVKEDLEREKVEEPALPQGQSLLQIDDAAAMQQTGDQEAGQPPPDMQEPEVPQQQ